MQWSLTHLQVKVLQGQVPCAPSASPLPLPRPRLRLHAWAAAWPPDNSTALRIVGDLRAAGPVQPE